MRDLVEHMLGITGKDEARVRELLLRGALVSGASRFRWNGWEADLAGIRDLLASFPDHEPARPFARSDAYGLSCAAAGRSWTFPREAGERKPLLRKTSFWLLLMETAAAGEPRYLHYSYKDRADCYRLEIPLAAAEKLARRWGDVMLHHAAGTDPLGGICMAELYAEREGAIPGAASAVRPPLPPG